MLNEGVHEDLIVRTLAGVDSTRAWEMREKLELRKKLFKQGGMIIAPTHDIQVGTPIENILAMYEAIGSLGKS